MFNIFEKPLDHKSINRNRIKREISIMKSSSDIENELQQLPPPLINNATTVRETHA